MFIVFSTFERHNKQKSSTLPQYKFFASVVINANVYSPFGGSEKITRCLMPKSDKRSGKYILTVKNRVCY